MRHLIGHIITPAGPHWEVFQRANGTLDIANAMQFDTLDELRADMVLMGARFEPLADAVAA